jgi:zinc protease
MSMPTAQTLPGADDILRCELNNGIIVLTRPNFNSPSISIQGYLPVGSVLDDDARLGLATFTASSLMRGTYHRDFQAIYDALETAGASLGFAGGSLFTSFGGKALAEDLELVLGLLYEALVSPTFPPEQVERLRAQHLTSLAIRAQDTASMASIAFDSKLFAGHPYSRPDDGMPETISAISRKDLEEFHKDWYGPKGMVVIVVGAIEPQAAVDLVKDKFESWEKPEQKKLLSLPDVKPLSGPERIHVNIPGKSQSDIILGVIGPDRLSKDFMPASLGNNILGQFGMFGRIGETVREKAGMAYYAYSSLTAGLGIGAWFAGAGVDPVNVDEAIDLIIQEVKKFLKDGVTKEELEDTKANYIGRLPLGLESNAGVGMAIMQLERYQLGLDYYRGYAELVNKVTLDEVSETGRIYWKDHQVVIASAGA